MFLPSGTTVLSTGNCGWDSMISGLQLNWRSSEIELCADITLFYNALYTLYLYRFLLYFRYFIFFCKI